MAASCCGVGCWPGGGGPDMLDGEVILSFVRCLCCVFFKSYKRFRLLAKGQRNQKFAIAESLSPREIYVTFLSYNQGHCVLFSKAFLRLFKPLLHLCR